MNQQPKPTGRPRGRVQDITMMLRCSADWLEAIDEWRDQQPDKPPRAKAIRLLVLHGIKTWGKKR
jgi:hypothetical protein